MKVITKHQRLSNMASLAEDQPKFFGQFKLNDLSLAFYVGRYAFLDAPLKIECGSAREPFATITSAFPGQSNVKLCEGEVIVKTYSENDILRAPLLASGYFKDTGKRIALPFGQLEIWNLGESFYEAFAKAYNVTFE